MIFLQIIFTLFALLSIGLAFSTLFFSVEQIAKRIGRKQFVGSRDQSEILICTLSWLGWGIVWYGGVYTILWFIPDSWGIFDENNEWESTRSSMSAFIAFFLSALTVQRLHRMMQR